MWAHRSSHFVVPAVYMHVISLTTYSVCFIFCVCLYASGSGTDSAGTRPGRRNDQLHPPIKWPPWASSPLSSPDASRLLTPKATTQHYCGVNWSGSMFPTGGRKSRPGRLEFVPEFSKVSKSYVLCTFGNKYPYCPSLLKSFMAYQVNHLPRHRTGVLQCSLRDRL